MSGGFSDLGCHSSSHNFICLQFPVLNPFLPEIPRIVYIFGLNLDWYTYVTPPSLSPCVLRLEPLFFIEPSVPRTRVLCFYLLWNKSSAVCWWGGGGDRLEWRRALGLWLLSGLVLVPVLPQLPELAGAVSYRVFGDSGVPVRVYLGFPCYRFSIQPCQLILVFLALTHLPSRFQTLLLWFMFSQKIPLLFFFWGFRKEWNWCVCVVCPGLPESYFSKLIIKKSLAVSFWHLLITFKAVSFLEFWDVRYNADHVRDWESVSSQLILNLGICAVLS